MIVRIEVLEDEVSTSGRKSDAVIRAIDRAMSGADWKSDGEGWIARH